MREPKIPVSKNPSQQMMFNPKMVQKNRSNEDNPATRKIPTRVKLKRPRKRNPNLSQLPRKAKVQKPRNPTAREEIAEEAESHKALDKKAKKITLSKIRRQKTTTNNRTLTSLPEMDAAVETETEAPRMNRKTRSHVNQDNPEKTEMSQKLKENQEMKMVVTEDLVVVEVEEVEVASEEAEVVNVGPVEVVSRIKTSHVNPENPVNLVKTTTKDVVREEAIATTNVDAVETKAETTMSDQRSNTLHRSILF